MPRKKRRHKPIEEPQALWEGYEENQRLQSAKSSTENDIARLLCRDLIDGTLPDEYLSWSDILGRR